MRTTVHGGFPKESYAEASHHSVMYCGRRNMEHLAAEDDACSLMTYLFLFASRSQTIDSAKVMRCAVSAAVPCSLSADGCAGVRLASSDPIAGAVQGQLESASTPPVAVFHDEIDLHPPCRPPHPILLSIRTYGRCEDTAPSPWTAPRLGYWTSDALFSIPVPPPR